MSAKSSKGLICIQELTVASRRRPLDKRFCDIKTIGTPQGSKDCFAKLEMENWKLRHRAVELALEIQALEERILQLDQRGGDCNPLPLDEVTLAYISEEARAGS